MFDLKDLSPESMSHLTKKFNTNSTLAKRFSNMKAIDGDITDDGECDHWCRRYIFCSTTAGDYDEF